MTLHGKQTQKGSRTDAKHERRTQWERDLERELLEQQLEREIELSEQRSGV